MGERPQNSPEHRHYVGVTFSERRWRLVEPDGAEDIAKLKEGVLSFILKAKSSEWSEKTKQANVFTWRKHQ